jgi:hypothetical protein
MKQNKTEYVKLPRTHSKIRMMIEREIRFKKFSIHSIEFYDYSARKLV